MPQNIDQITALKQAGSTAITSTSQDKGETRLKTVDSFMHH